MSTTDIARLILRHRCFVTGTVVSIAAVERPWVYADVEISDGTGTLVLRFVGRRTVPSGVVAGGRMFVEGTPGLVDGAVVMLNPIYSLVGDG